jgi:hypothetical protein
MFDLTLSDFRICPIWTMFDDDGDDVVPVHYPSWETDAGGGALMYVACAFTLHDGTTVQGVVAVDNSNMMIPYALLFARSDGILEQFLINTYDEDDASRANLARFLNKTVDQVYPIRYATPFKSRDGHLIAGEHN